jgi:hypothetical protein
MPTDWRGFVCEAHTCCRSSALASAS